MSTFKLNILSLFLILSLASFSTIYANSPIIVNEATSSLLMPKRVMVIAHGSQVIPTNTSIELVAKATNPGGSLVSLTISVNATPVSSVSSVIGSISFEKTSYTPASPGTYSLMAVATYSDGTSITHSGTFTAI